MKHYNDFQIMQLKHKLEQNNKIKLIKLGKGETLDNIIIFRCDENTLQIMKYNNQKYTMRHNFAKYPYVLVKGSDKNVHTVVEECCLNLNNVFIKLKVPCQTNFMKKIIEELDERFERLKRYYHSEIKNGFETRHYIEDNENDEEVELRVSITRYFRLIDISEQDFENEVHKINLLRYV